jgi:hypothetical protein
MRVLIQVVVFIVVGYGLTQWENASFAGQSFSLAQVLLMLVADGLVAFYAAKLVGRISLLL